MKVRYLFPRLLFAAKTCIVSVKPRNRIFMGILTLGMALSYKSTSCASENFTDAVSRSTMFPSIKFYEKGSLEVTDLHTLSYRCYGNPTGKPVVLLHGGPGGSCNAGTTASYFAQPMISCRHGSLF